MNDKTEKHPAPSKSNQVDENSGIRLDGFLKISDPETGEVLVSKRDE